MSEPKWTPGPWTAEWDDNGYWYIEPLGVTGTRLRGDSGECLERANAHLIAAAPEYDEAAGMLLSALELHGADSMEFFEARNRLMEVRSKARGEAEECPTCRDIREQHKGFGPSHDGSPRCESGSIASGGQHAHCSCSVCF